MIDFMVTQNGVWEGVRHETRSHGSSSMLAALRGTHPSLSRSKGFAVLCRDGVRLCALQQAFGKEA
eukprot:4675203-Amphidinium_carterae.2